MALPGPRLTRVRVNVSTSPTVTSGADDTLVSSRSAGGGVGTTTPAWAWLLDGSGSISSAEATEATLKWLPGKSAVAATRRGAVPPTGSVPTDQMPVAGS